MMVATHNCQQRRTGHFIGWSSLALWLACFLSAGLGVIINVDGQSVREHVRRRDSTPAPLVAKNLFIESSSLVRCRDVQTRSQFYKTNSSIRRLYDCIEEDNNQRYKRLILVTGGAGFIGSHLVDSLMLDGNRVVVVDNLSTGRKSNVEHWIGHANFKLIEHDVINELASELTGVKFSEIYHLASPASPVHYMANPMNTINTIVLGTMNILKLARSMNARVVLASTSEVYGDPLVHPQHEGYWGNTNPIGPRSCYDESKRLSETLAIANRDQYNVSIGIVRIFNTYGPRMNRNDGRVISNFVTQALQNKPLTIHGTGNQTRSFQYISDLVTGLRALMASNMTSPVNLGNPDEITIMTLAREVKKIITRSSSELVNDELPVDDPLRRRPDIHKAQEELNWRPIVPLKSGLERTIDYFILDLKN
jgi:UDP-glucuronate decarboxylase